MTTNKLTEKIVSVIIPIYNGDKWIYNCFESIIQQDALNKIPIEICVYNDGSSDLTLNILKELERKIFDLPNLSLKITSGLGSPRGVGFAKNRAVADSSGTYLCFQDIDDVMDPNRISKQLECCKNFPNAIVGSCFKREPKGSTARFTRWANNLPQELLKVQVFTSHGPTVVMPTWFCSREVFNRVGGFSETGSGTPEDLIFFYNHLDLGGDIRRVNEELLMYRFHPEATTLSISEETIWNLRVKRLEEKILPLWGKFTIWNAGKQGRKLWRSLSKQNREKVESMCDVDVHKVGKYYRPYSPDARFDAIAIPIRHFRDASPPFIICVKLDMTNGVFEQNLSSLKLNEGLDYILFS